MNNAKDSYLLTPTFHWVRQTASRMIAFGFGSGLSPFAPGTAGTLWAWGLNSYGQLGNNSLTNFSSPIQVEIGRAHV